MAAVGEVEGLIDEREIRDDVADDRVLEHRPVLPRGIVRMAAADRAGRARLERDEYRAAPTLDQSRADHADRRQVDGAQMRAGRQSRRESRSMRRQDSCTSSNRTATRAATSPSRRLHFTSGEFRVRRAGHIAAQVERLAARAPG